VSVDDYLIRYATRDEIAFLPSVEKRAVRQFEGWLAETGLTGAILDDVSSLEELGDAQRRGHLWVAVAPDGELVGFAQVIVLDQLAHLDEVDVVPEHGRKGVGSRLVAAVTDWARQAGYPKMTLSTFRDVPWNRPFYEKRGFCVVDSRHLWPEHAALVAAERARGLRTDLRVIMECSLAD
jgi:GNAT superfamily N-acetyltransferase